MQDLPVGGLLQQFLFGFSRLFAIINPYGLSFIFLDRTIALSSRERRIVERESASTITSRSLRSLRSTAIRLSWRLRQILIAFGNDADRAPALSCGPDCSVCPTIPGARAGQTCGRRAHIG